jgi:Fe-S cluster assembly protein SufD
MIAATQECKRTDAFRSSFDEVKRGDGAVPPWLRRLRGDAFQRFVELGFPSTRHEEWRFTNVAPMTKTHFDLAQPPSEEVQLDAIAPFLFSREFPRLVFVNGRHSPKLSWLPDMPDRAVARGVAEALVSCPDVVQAVLGGYADHDDAPFIALNTSMVQDGAFIHIPQGTIVEQPIHLLFVSVSPSGRYASHPRNVIVIGPQAQATIIESHVGLDDEVYFTNVVTEATLGDGAALDHYKIQQESTEAYHIATTQVNQSANTRFSSHYFSFGGKLVRNEVNPVLDAEGCECTLGGLYIAAGRQHVDSRTRIDHAKPHCNSFELYKGILDDRAKGVFNGKIYVHQDAQKTDAKQSNQVLLLSDDAVIDTKPQLEIYADYVKCTHGATVGQLDDEALFYLRSRGIPQDLARSLLIYAFGNEVVEGLKVEPVRARLEELLLADRSLANLSGG